MSERVVIISIHFYPDQVGIAKYTYELASSLASEGSLIHVICAPPFFPAWKAVANKYSVSFLAPRLRVSRAPLWVPATPTTLSRLVHLFSFVLTSIPLFILEITFRPQKILVVCPTLLLIPSAFLLKCFNLGRSLLWLHFQDFEIQAATDLGLIKSSKLTRSFSLLTERLFLGTADLVTTISPGMLARIDTLRLSKTKSFLFPNWVDTESIYPCKSLSGNLNYYRRLINVGSSEILILYSGSFGVKQGFQGLVPVISGLSCLPNIRWLFVGAGPSYSSFKSAVSQFHNVSFLPLQPQEKVNELLNAADIHIIPQFQVSHESFLPSKLLGQLSSGRPIVGTASATSDLGRILSQVGFAAPTESRQSLIDAILALADDAELRQLLGKRARDLAVSEYSFRSVFANLKLRLNSL